ncbi:carotenoid 1,2-hydratase [Limimaricola pyoseonensis]|uniref:carotenoid 1,2-hydratase n=1 Tax=Limimaricola pyoseonensis TaxID=521013 RepID=UPI003BF98F86
MGSVFSPWYGWSGRGDPENHVCLNVATYGPGGRFCMTDRGRSALRRGRDALEIGPSRMRWSGGRLVVEVDEVAAPPQIGRLRGRILLEPAAVTGIEMVLDGEGAHVWRPFAPAARVVVELGDGNTWRGHGYLDSNFGTRPLETDFSHWSWARFPVPGGAVAYYEALGRDGQRRGAAIRFTDGAAQEMAMPDPAPLPRTLWGLRRSIPAAPGVTPRQHLSMLDSPFYCRAAVASRIDGAERIGVHETLDLNRFRAPWLKPMLAMRVPRRARWPRAGTA